MTKKKAIGIAALVTVGIAALLLTLWLNSPRHGITSATWIRIEPGMSEEDVLRLLRVPPGDHTTRPLDAYAVATIVAAREAIGEQLKFMAPKGAPLLRAKEWIADDGALFVYFNESGLVDNSSYFDLRERPSLVDCIREWFHVHFAN